MYYERLTLVLPQAEMHALRAKARAELRKPRDQARLMLRAMLLNEGFLSESEQGEAEDDPQHSDARTGDQGG